MTGVSTSTAIMLAGMAASGAGAYMTQKNNNDNVNRERTAINNVAQQGVAQQDADAAKSGAVLNNTINGFQAPQQGTDLGSLITARQTTIGSNTGTPSSIIDPTANANAPKVVQSDLANKMASATAFGNQQGDALGRIAGNTDQMMGNQINLNASGQKIGQLTNFAQGDYRANKALQQSASSNARRPPSVAATALSQAGNAASIYGAGAGGVGDLIAPSTTSAAADQNFLNSAYKSAGIYGPYQ